MKKFWREKLANDKGLPKVCEVRAGHGTRSGEGRMVIAASREVDVLVKQSPRGIVSKSKRMLVADFEKKLFTKLL